MTMPFSYDMALSFVAEDALTARHLTGRVRDQLGAGIFDPASLGGTTGAVPSAVLRDGARVVVVLHQRLWGQTPSTRGDLEAIERRVAREGNAFLVVVMMEPGSDVPSCLRARGATRVSLSEDGAREVDAIVAAVRRAGGSTGRAKNGDDKAHDATANGSGYDSLRTPAKAALAAQRETEAVIAEIEARIKAIRQATPETTVRLRRSPDRCVVQAGDIGLSVSWLRPANVIPEGSLLVIEWTGTITLPGEEAQPRFRAIAVSEDELHLEIAAPPAWSGTAGWNWWSDGAPMRKYTSRDLGALCVQRLLQRVEDAASA